MGFGMLCHSYGHEISQAVAWALECGYRYIDSAAMYANEKDVGEGLRLAGLDRKKVYILSKVWPKDYECARQLGPTVPQGSGRGLSGLLPAPLAWNGGEATSVRL